MDVDKPGKDSYELRKAGAAQTIVASEQRWALMTETPETPELDLTWLVSRMDASKLDLVLVEGSSMNPCRRSYFSAKQRPSCRRADN